jgi:hypothetical protein
MFPSGIFFLGFWGGKVAKFFSSLSCSADLCMAELSLARWTFLPRPLLHLVLAYALSRQDKVEWFLAAQAGEWVTWIPRIGRGGCYVLERWCASDEDKLVLDCVILQETPNRTRRRRWRRRRAQSKIVPFGQRVTKDALREALLACDAEDWVDSVTPIQLHPNAPGGVGASKPKRCVWFRLPSYFFPIFDVHWESPDPEKLRVCGAEWNIVVDSLLTGVVDLMLDS